MAFETEQGNVTKTDASLSSLIAPAFVEKAKALGHCAIDYWAANNSTLRASQEGSFTGEIQSTESTGTYTFDSGDEYSETDTDLTAQTYWHIYKPTVQAERFSSKVLAKAPALQADALARKVDATWLALITGFTNTVEAAGASLSKDDLLDAQYTVHAALNSDDTLHIVTNRAMRTELRKEVTDTSASAFSKEVMLQMATRKVNPQGFYGEFCDMLMFNTSGLPQDSTDDIAACFHPSYAFFLGLDPTVYTRAQFVASNGLYTEVASWMFANVGEWIDDAGCQLRRNIPS